MARIYSGLNALALGRGVNDLHNGLANQRISALEKLAGGLQDAFAQRREEQIANEQKMSAIDLLANSGMYDRQKAENMVGALGAGEAAKFLTGQLATQDERAYNKGLRDEQWKREDALGDKNDKLKIALTEFNDLNNRIATLQMKVQSGSLPSMQDIEEMNQLKSMRNEWLKLHPDFSQIMFTSGMSGNTANPFESKETAMAAMNGLIGKDGFVDPKSLNDLDTQFLWQTGHNLFNDPEYKDVYNHLAKRQRGSKNKRNALNPESNGIVTQQDLENIEKNEAEMARLSGLHKTIHNALKKGKISELQNISDNDLEKLLLLEGDGKLKKGVVSIFKKRRGANGRK